MSVSSGPVLSFMESVPGVAAISIMVQGLWEAISPVVPAAPESESDSQDASRVENIGATRYVEKPASAAFLAAAMRAMTALAETGKSPAGAGDELPELCLCGRVFADTPTSSEARCCLNCGEGHALQARNNWIEVMRQKANWGSRYSEVDTTSVVGHCHTEECNKRHADVVIKAKAGTLAYKDVPGLKKRLTVAATIAVNGTPLLP